VPRRSRLRVSKTRIRHLMRRFAQHEVDDIDRFREHVHEGRAQRQRALQRRTESLPPEMQELLADQMSELDVISSLAEELTIIALYRVLELNTGRMLAHEFGKARIKKEKVASNVGTLKKFLRKERGIDLCSVPHYQAINQLRCLNNKIKHEGLGDKELKTLDKAYVRLRPKVPAYIFRLAERLKLRYR
jgi:hypothetical protein